MVELKYTPPSDFLKEETRCDYTISKQMKEIWAIEIDLLQEFQRVCSKYNIKYVVNGGTMLGAVRHHGFIPWDDDIDIMMLRSEYDKICNLSSEFKHPYFFQIEKTDPGSLRGHAQLRNSETTAILKHELKWKRPFNQGIFIDIFPIDNVQENPYIDKLGEISSKFFKKASSFFANISIRKHMDNQPTLYKFIHSTFYKFNIFMMDTCYNVYEYILKHIGSKDSTKVASLCFVYTKKKFLRERKWFYDLISVPFEYITVPIFKEYDTALTNSFGNWHQLINCGNTHGGAHFDTERPYTYYTEGEGVFK